MDDDTATTLFGLPGVGVVEVEDEPDGSTTVYVQTADPDALLCPDCHSRARRCKQRVVCDGEVRTGVAAFRAGV